MGTPASEPDPVPDDEDQRLRARERTGILDTPPDQAFDDLVSLAATICGTPSALMNLVDDDRQWSKARLGFDHEETPRRHAFCAHTIMDPGRIMVVPNAVDDPRFADNPLVTADDGIRVYAGAPIVNRAGHALGTICVADTEPGRLTHENRQGLEALSRTASRLLELRSERQSR